MQDLSPSITRSQFLLVTMGLLEHPSNIVQMVDSYQGGYQLQVRIGLEKYGYRHLEARVSQSGVLPFQL